MPGLIQPIEIHVGRGDIFIDVDVPATPPVPLVGGVPTTGRFVGATVAPANFIYRPTTFDIRTQQDTGIVGYVVTEEELRVEFEIGELTYDNIRDYLIGGTPKGDHITLGGTIFPALHSVLIVVPKRIGGGAFIQAMLYQSVFAEERSVPFARESWANVRIIARAQSLVTRALGDRQGFLFPHVVTS